MRLRSLVVLPTNDKIVSSMSEKDTDAGIELAAFVYVAPFWGCMAGVSCEVAWMIGCLELDN